MEKTNQNYSGVNGIINRARRYQPEIGNYLEHFINEHFDYTIRLNNGRMEIPMTAAQDQERMPASISEKQIQIIANSFQSNTPKPSISQTPVTSNKMKDKGFWEKFLSFFGIK